MFDTHCHLTDDTFKNNLLEVINSARDVGVEEFLIPSSNIEDAKKALLMIQDYQNVYCSIGIHPTEKLETFTDNIYKTIDKIQELIDKKENIKAIGECGLDFYHFKSPESIQKKIFEIQLILAIKNDFPVIIHNRQATAVLLPILQKLCIKANFSRIIFHCCPPEKELLDFALKNNIFIGVDGDVTYDLEKSEFVKNIPLELLLLETDSPNLTPEPVRSERKYPNSPLNLIYIAEKIASIKNVKLSEIIEITTKNAHTIFSI